MPQHKKMNEKKNKSKLEKEYRKCDLIAGII